MASQWAATLPVVTVPRGVTPKRVTFVYPFYENHRFLWDQIAHWHTYAQSLRWHLRAVIVDDGSPDPIRLPPRLPFPMRVFRIVPDIPWNWLAARNIGAHHADTPWLMMTDMDHMVPEATAEALVCGEHDPSVMYAFSRREHTGQNVTPHSASFFLSRELFWRIGGYDETLSGHYGTDGEYRRRAMKVATFQVLTDTLTRYEFVADSCTARYQRKLPSDAVQVTHLVSQRGPNWRPKVLSFPYHEIPISPVAVVS